MANVVHPPIDFHHRPVAPILGFGFGMSLPASKVGWQQQPTVTLGHNNPTAFHQLASTMSQSSPNRAQKRRHEPEDEEAAGRHGSCHATATGSRDDAMDRSPTPERPKRAPPKRARVMNVVETGNKEKSKENKPPGDGDAGNVDVGVLLASLPPQALLPLLTSLLNAQPSLKSTILPLIPRPTLETAIQVLAQSAKKLRDAYPYSNTPTFSASPTGSSSSPTSFGFGSGFGSARSSTSMFGSSTVGFGRPAQTSMFGQSQSQASTSSNNGGMRDSYILSRLRPHITEFVSTCMSYLPYFSYIPTSSSSSPASSSTQPRLPTPKEKPHPSETFLLLSALTSHILSQPPLTQSSLGPLLLPRLHTEWLAWVDRVDVVVNIEGGMFGGEVVKGWEKGLDEFAEAKNGTEGAGWECMRDVRERWVGKVGWLVGRRAIGGMDMEEL